jgi:phosphoenolpyruvate carboxylase
MGAGLERVRARHGIELLREMRVGWFFFGALIDDVEAMLARADLGIARYYDGLVDERLRHFFAPLREEFDRTCRLVLEIKGCEHLLDSDRTLQRAIQLRNPYVDPMHLMQVDLLRRWRHGGREDQETFNALQSSITGISQGLQSTG